MAPFNTAAKNDVEAAPLDEDLRLRFRLVPDAARTHTHTHTQQHAVSANVATTPLPVIVAHSQRRVTYRRGRRSCYETGMERWHHVRPCHPDSSCTSHAQALAVPNTSKGVAVSHGGKHNQHHHHRADDVRSSPVHDRHS